jgi:hypothetical protein
LLAASSRDGVEEVALANFRRFSDVGGKATPFRMTAQGV